MTINNLTLLFSLVLQQVHNESVKPRDMWVTTFVVLQNLNKIALSFTSKEIGKSVLMFVFLCINVRMSDGVLQYVALFPFYH